MGWNLVLHRLYMTSPEWETKKSLVRSIYQRHYWPTSCIRCGSDKRLQLHHNYYMRDIDSANLSDLDWVCRDCHEAWHRICPGYAQNRFTKQNFAFYTSDPRNKRYVMDLLRQKITMDQQEILSYFNRSEVLQYEIAEKRKNIVLLWASIASLVMIYPYGIGIFTLFASFIFIRNRVPKPSDLDAWDERRFVLRVKAEMLEQSAF